MIEPSSPLQSVWQTGTHPNSAGKIGIVLSETQPGSIVEITSMPGSEKQIRAAIRKTLGISLSEEPGRGIVKKTATAFSFAPSRFLVTAKEPGADAKLTKAISLQHGAVLPISNGLTTIRVSGPRSERVMAKLFKMDFSEEKFPLGTACATTQHDIATRVQRTGKNQFDIYVFRSFARNFQALLCNAAADIGYKIK